MTIIAGIVRINGEALPDGWVASLRSAISRYESDVPACAASDWFVVAKVDIGALPVRGDVVTSDGGIAMVAGDPVMTFGRERTGDRRTDVESLFAAWRQRRAEPLKSCQGTYCAVLLDPPSRRLCLVVDKLAVRPLYYAIEGDTIFFASAIRILESLPFVPKRFDITGTAETVAFGFPLGSRTAYTNITCLESGELLEFSDRGPHREFYWRWDELPRNELVAGQLAADVYARFERAIARRLGTQSSVIAFLSGGLDSRCIVAVLRKLGARVHTMNFAPEGTLDLELGRRVAESLVTDHFEHPLGPAVIGDKQVIAHAAWRKRQAAHDSAVTSPSVIWSGDGGSVGMGHVYLNEQMVQTARQEGTEAAAHLLALVNDYGLPKRLLRGKVQSALAATALRGIRVELDRLKGFDAGRNLHLFFMFNDQRRHLADHFENIDLRRLELELPFFDGEFLESILTSDVDAFLMHRFYNRWLAHFPKPTRAVAWQAYPGHEPGPLDAGADLRNQWVNLYDTQQERQQRRQLVDEADALLAAECFPREILRPAVLRMARWAIRAGRGDYAHVVRTASIFTRHWCGSEESRH